MTEVGEIEYAAPARVNLFPAKVIEPDGGTMADTVRVIITATLAVVYGERRTPTGLRQIYTQMKIPITESHPHPGRTGGWIVTSEGREWEILRGGGCGCGSALKAGFPSPPPVDIP